MIKLDKKLFFDQEAVLKAMSRAEAKALSRFGSYVRRRARSSLRRRKKVASEGQKPSVHTKDKYRTLKNILFQYEPKKRSVIIGPVKLRTSRVKGSNTLPEIHEFGKSGIVTDRDGTETRVKYPARPFMQPALLEETRKGTLLQEFHNSL